MGLPVEKADQETEKLLWSLYTEYAAMMELGNPFVPLAYAPDAAATKTKTARFTPAIIESAHALDAYTIELDLTWEKQEVILPDGGKRKQRSLQCQQKAASWQRKT